MMSGFSEDLVAAILGRQATGDAAGAAELIGGADLSADDRQVLLAAVAERPPAEFAAGLGAILRRERPQPLQKGGNLALLAQKADPDPLQGVQGLR